MRKEEKREIDGVEYSCVQFNVKKSLRVLTKLGKRLGKPIASVFDKIDPQKRLEDQKLAELGLGEALDQIFMNMEDDELYVLAKDICSDVIARQTETRPGGQLKDDRFDTHFTGADAIQRLFKVCKFALEVNYGDFLSAVAGDAGLRAAGEVRSRNSSTRVR